MATQAPGAARGAVVIASFSGKVELQHGNPTGAGHDDRREHGISGLLQTSDDSGFLRNVAQMTLQRLTEFQVDNLCGAGTIYCGKIESGSGR